MTKYQKIVSQVYQSRLKLAYYNLFHPLPLFGIEAPKREKKGGEGKHRKSLVITTASFIAFFFIIYVVVVVGTGNAH